MTLLKMNCIIGKVVLGLSVLTVLPLAVARQNVQSGSNGNGSNNGNVTNQVPRGGDISRSNGNNDPQSRYRRMGGSLYVAGIVVQDDGNPPPMETLIEQVCPSGVTKEVYVSPDGSFGYQVGGSGSVLPDASDVSSPETWNPSANSLGNPSGSAGVVRLNDCVLRASAAGYRSSELPLYISQTSGSVNVGTLVISPSVRVTGTTVSVTNLAAPKKAKKALNQAEKAIQKKDLPDAEKELRAAIAAYPSYADAWYALGLICERSGRIEDAQNDFSTALKSDANYVKPYIELARMAAREPKWQVAADLTARALDLDPIDLPEGYLINSIANLYLNNVAAAERSAHKLERLDSAHRFPQVHLVLANILRRRNDRAGEADQLRAYLKYAPRAANAPQVYSRLQELIGTNPG